MWMAELLVTATALYFAVRALVRRGVRNLGRKARGFRGCGCELGIPVDHPAGNRRTVAFTAEKVAPMTRPLRRVHRLTWLALAVILPILYFAAIAARRDAQPSNAGLDWSFYQ